LEHYPHGVIGLDPRQASAEVGERVVAAAVATYEQVLNDWRQA
jgi:creatinine amidohydrolase/Fe(II)-dependent formamide hydrolase-like protein